ncbi:MAG TPA: HlyD family efflux transporter periplasmic adaptor subunit [Ramlibacter sp.]|uniref:efflux RND transporter periplasmic adaptor subunit n=1 Tax=Ramlibacter sp. TaxID=1917967 RepID=UPI002D0ACE6F|nr:HlyD family efflux transporter periplasmic adaptor subunit [Ramlibacter sp.]HVZ42986.1 HlyD family efflux transporter periplasmic adaptor subunit [Ramlibacter sp.]
MTLSAEAALELLGAARSAASEAERRFILLNRTRDAVAYHAAALWQRGSLVAHSGASAVDASGPYGQWLDALFGELHAKFPNGGRVNPTLVAPALAEGWAEWLPERALWLPQATGDGGWLLVRDIEWPDNEALWLAQWWSLWLMADQAAQSGARARVFDWRLLVQRIRSGAWRPRHTRRTWITAAAVLALLVLPVRLTVRAPGEIVPREPTVLRATMDGMAQKLLVEPNQVVKAGTLLAVLDDAAASSRLQASRQSLAAAEAEWRQTVQQALTDPRAKAALAAAQGRVEEKRAEVGFLGEQMRRTEVRAPHDGVVLVDDPGAWAGRTVAAGEPLIRIARPDDQEVEAWLPVADAVDLPEGSAMELFLSSRPASPVHARLRLYSFEPQQRPDGTLAYRIRGKLTEPPSERLGSRGTVHLDGRRVPLIYWVLRRPLAALREATGW